MSHKEEKRRFYGSRITPTGCARLGDGAHGRSSDGGGLVSSNGGVRCRSRRRTVTHPVRAPQSQPSDATHRRTERFDPGELGKTLRGSAQSHAVVSAEVRSSNRQEPERGVRNRTIRLFSLVRAGFVLPDERIPVALSVTADQAGENERWRRAGRSAAGNSICRMVRPAKSGCTVVRQRACGVSAGRAPGVVKALGGRQNVGGYVARGCRRDGRRPRCHGIV
jgi:hypothetical protein